MALKLSRENVEAAKALLDHPVINEIFSSLERDAIEGAMNAGPLEHDLRFALLKEAQIVRSLRSKLTTLVAREAGLNA